MVRNLIFGSGASFLVSFSSLVLIARLFPFDFISDVKAVTLYGGWFSLVFTCQVQSAFLFFHNKPGQSSDSAKVFTLGFLLMASVLSGGAFYFFFPNLYAPEGIDGGGMAAFSILVGLNLLFMVSPAVYTAQGISRKLPFLMFLYPSSTFISLLVGRILGFNVNQYAITLACLSGMVLWLSEWRGYVWFSFRRLPEIFSSYNSSFGSYSAKISISIFFESLGDRVDKILASRFLSQSVFAKYSVLCFENPIVGVLLNSYGLAMVKGFQGGISGKEEGFISAWERMVRLITFITFPISVFLWFHHGWFISTVFGERFLGASAILQIYLLVSLVRYAPFQALLRMEGVVHYNVIMSVLFFLAAAGVGGTVVWSGWGWEHMAYSYLSGWLVFNGTAVFFFTRISSVRLHEVLALHVWASRLAQCAVAGAAGVVLSNGSVYLSLASSSIVYLALVMFFDKIIRDLIFDQASSWWKLCRAGLYPMRER